MLIDYRWFLAAVLGLEITCNAVSLAKNRALPATHSYLAKGWAVMLALSFAVVLGWGAAFPLLDLTLAYGILVDLEVIAIILLTPGAAVDVPTVIHAWRFRRAGGVRRAAASSPPVSPLPIHRRADAAARSNGTFP